MEKYILIILIILIIIMFNIFKFNIKIQNIFNIFQIIDTIKIDYSNFNKIYKDKIIKKKRKNKEYMKKIMVEIGDILNKYNIFFYLSEGTALGIYRDGDILEWDDDIDFGIFDKDLNKFLYDVVPELRKKGYIVGRNGYTYWAYNDSVSIDFEIVTRNKLCISKMWKSCNELSKYLNNFKIVEYNNRKWNLPLEGYYEYLYGKNWRIPNKNKINIINKMML